MSALTQDEKIDLVIKHALKMRSAWSLSNYHSFFQLYPTTPNMGGYLLDLFVERERQRAVKMLVKSWVILFCAFLGFFLISLPKFPSILSFAPLLYVSIFENLYNPT